MAKQDDWFATNLPEVPQAMGPPPVAEPAPQASLANPRGVNYGTPQDSTEFRWQQFINSVAPSANRADSANFRTQGNLSIPDLVAQFNRETGGHAQFVGGPSGDRVDFGDGRGPTDIRTSRGELWYDNGQGGGGGAQGGGGGGGAQGGSSSSYANGGGGAPGGFQFAPWEGHFVAPTEVTEQNDPGYRFRQQQAQEGLEKSAAGRGTALTGGFQKDLASLNQGLASQEYGNVYNRALGQYGQDYNDYLGNETRRFQAHQANFGNTLANRQEGRQAQQQGWQQEYLGNQNAYDQGLRTNQTLFNQQFSLADLGMRGAMGGGGQEFANNASNLVTGIGNANAMGQVSSANAWNQGANSLSNIGSNALAEWYANQGRGPKGVQASGVGPSNGVWG